MFMNRVIRRVLLLLGISSTLILLCITIFTTTLSKETVIYTVYSNSRNDVVPEPDEIKGYFETTVQKPSEESYCKFYYRLPKDLKFSKKHVKVGPEQAKKSTYKILYNVIKSRLDPNMPNVTFATHVTAEYVDYIPEILKTWEGPVSISAFVPDLDVAFVLEQINQYCYCIPAMSRVSLHLVYPKKIVPSKKDVYFTRPDNCVFINSRDIKTHRYFDEEVVYPANVCRNVARNSAPTTFVLVADADFIPSEGLATRFTKMINGNKDFQQLKRRVFVVPTFEVDPSENIPIKKSDLVKLVKRNKARYIDSKSCESCHEMPGMNTWLQTDSGNTIEIFAKVKREQPLHRWTPLFISSKGAPFYHEVLTWEGVADRDMQLLELCLKGYMFYILDGAFLVHRPREEDDEDSEEWRQRFIRENSKQSYVILWSLLKRYESNPKCMLSEAVNHHERNLFESP